MADKVNFRVAHLKITDHLVLGITQDKIRKGVEESKYLNLQCQPMMGWQQVANSLKDGQVDAAFILAPTAMDLYKAGLKAKLILFSHKSGSVLITNKKAHIQTIQDFKGKVVIIPYQLSVHNMLLHKLCSEAGIEPGAGKDVQLEVMAPSQMVEALQYDEEGEIAGFIVAEPFASQAVTEGYGEEFTLSKDIWPEHPCCALVVRDEMIENHPDAVHEFTDSLVKSGRFIDTAVSTAARIGADFLGQKAEVIKRVLTEPADRITTANLFP
ncbi:MAG: ABC transporter substrate-binding protein, partial [Desulfobulbaceae bacterium]|nr:ABC transporter substrate-binding protein [Desulfobulbaceae bacterium]